MLIGTHKERKKEIRIELAQIPSTVAQSDLPTGKTSIFFIFKRIDLVKHLMVTYTEWAKPGLLRKRKNFLLYLSTKIVCVFCLFRVLIHKYSCTFSSFRIFLHAVLLAARMGHGDVKISQVCLPGIWLLCILSLPIVLLICCCAWWSLVPAAPNKTMCVVRCVAFCYQIWLREVEDSAWGLKLPWNPHKIASLVLYR